MPEYCLDLATAYGPLRGLFALPDGAIRLSDLARAALPVAQQLTDLMESAYARAGRRASCRKGCGACCRQSVPVSPPEALLLAEWIDAQPKERRHTLEARFQAAQSRFIAAGIGESGLPPGASSAEIRSHSLAYFRQGVACPLLEGEACSAHPLRPVACRNHLVFTPAQACAEPERGGIKVMNPRFSLGTILSMLAAEAAGMEPIKLPLISLIEWTRLHGDLRERRFDGARLAQRFIELLSGFCGRSLLPSSGTTAASNLAQSPQVTARVSAPAP